MVPASCAARVIVLVGQASDPATAIAGDLGLGACGRRINEFRRVGGPDRLARPDGGTPGAATDVHDTSSSTIDLRKEE